VSRYVRLPPSAVPYSGNDDDPRPTTRVPAIHRILVTRAPIERSWCGISRHCEDKTGQSPLQLRFTA
jgi:hypothetical protein